MMKNQFQTKEKFELEDCMAGAPQSIPVTQIDSDETGGHPYLIPAVQTHPLPAGTLADVPPAPANAAHAPILFRLFEIMVAITALTVFSPIMLIEALIIRLGTPGPALFFQNRVGKGGGLFRFVKFRTLYADARKRYPELYAYKYEEKDLEELKFKVENDPRVTPQGRWLRRSTLDELPNFWNLLKGDMALVGPRPEIPEMVKYYKGEMLLKFSVKPGITGLAQVSGRGRLGFHETVELDLEYVRTRSVWLDIRILFRTLKITVLGDGAF